MNAPIPINQLTLPEGYVIDQEACGECSVASAATALGLPTTAVEVIDDLRAHGDTVGITEGTDREVLTAWCLRRGVTVETFSWLRDAYGIVLCKVRLPYSVPDPAGTSLHWLLRYAPSMYAQSNGGYLARYDDAVVALAFVDAFIMTRPAQGGAAAPSPLLTLGG